MFLLCTSINHSWAYTSCWFRSTGLWVFFFSYLNFTLPVSGCWQRASWMGLGVLFYDSLSWASSAHVQHVPTTTSFIRLSHRNHPADLGFLPSPFSPKEASWSSPFSPLAEKSKGPPHPMTRWTHTSHSHPQAPSPMPPIYWAGSLTTTTKQPVYLKAYFQRPKDRRKNSLNLDSFPDLLDKLFPIAKTDRQTDTDPLPTSAWTWKKKKSHSFSESCYSHGFLNH